MGIRQEGLFKVRAVPLEKREPQGVPAYFGENIFSVEKMKAYLSPATFEAFLLWQTEGKTIPLDQANEIAEAMKRWATGRGASFYTHWFQPLTGLTAEKHDSFISPDGPGKVVEKFSGEKLIQGEPDASSFPSGGIRATFEARGYTAWDPSSPAFITESRLGKTLCIPSIFVSYHGDALDQKLPLLRSEEALSAAARKLLALFGRTDVKKVVSTCGPEQEFFLIDRRFYNLRQDLLMTGRTLIGADSPKGQQLEDQYFGAIKERVLDYMCEVAQEAYRIGIPLTTRHNEVAPHQYEFAPFFEESNLATDHNLLLMDLMKRVALRHDLVCLLHEKPFAGINGSGKHLNWSLADDKGTNLLHPGDSPEENLLFLAILAAVLRAVHAHADLLRASVAIAGNEHRLGANEAPPAIISVFVGEQLDHTLNAIEQGIATRASKRNAIDLGLARLPKFLRDVTDRNRTSPFAFTGTKFEFRAVGSSQNISTPIMVINTIVAESIDWMAERIQKAAAGGDFRKAALQVIAEAVRESKPIRFEGNNYAEEWVKEARRRGLPNIASTCEALEAYRNPQNIQLFEKYGVLTKQEMEARYHVGINTYNLILEIEASTLCEMVSASVVPPGMEYANLLAGTLSASAAASAAIPKAVLADQKAHLREVLSDIYYVRRTTGELVKLLRKAREMEAEKRAALYYAEMRPLMDHIRRHADDLERVVSDEHWDLPKYREMLFIS